MKQIIKALVVSVVLSAAAGQVWANDPLKVAPNLYLLVFENERVRVMQATFKPGEQIKEHSHPDHFVYVLEGGQLTISKPDGSLNVAEVNVGQVLWIPAESHWAKNTGKSTVRLLVNELKPAKK